ncbi:MAG: hypothetical protein ACTHQE_10550 [Thermomicrobiales bacterium]
MIAVASLIPNDPNEQRTVLSLLDAHPEVRSFVARASTETNPDHLRSAFTVEESKSRLP